MIFVRKFAKHKGESLKILTQHLGVSLVFINECTCICLCVCVCAHTQICMYFYSKFVHIWLDALFFPLYC